MIINHNLGAMNANRNMGINASNANKSMEKLSSGLRINKAGDDAAGLAISEKMRGQIRGLDQAGANAQDGISMIQTGEGALNETTSILQRMRELAVQGSNDTNTTEDRNQIQKEMNQLTSEVSRIGENTEFNGQKLLNGTGGVATGGTTTTIGFAASTVGNVATTVITPDAGNNVLTADITSTGNFTGVADDSLTFEATASGYSIDGGVTDVVLTAGKFSYKGVSIDTTATTASVPTVGDQWVIALTAAVAPTADVPAHDVTTGASSAFTFQIGANQAQQFTASISDMRSSALGISGVAGDTAEGVGTTVVAGASFVAIGAENDLSDETTTGEHALDISTSTKATAAIKVLDAATAAVSGERAKLGAYSNRLEHTIANLGTSSENLTSAESRIRDVDMAKEMSTFSKNNILSQAAQAMLAQANQQPQQVLQLLR